MFSFIKQNADRRIVIAGQSNARGYGQISEISSKSKLVADPGLATLAANPFERVKIFNPDTGAYQSLLLNNNNLTGGGIGTFGPEFGIAVRWTRETKYGTLYIDKYARNGEAIAYYAKGGAFYTTGQTHRATANAWLAANSKNPVECGLLWVQGESDYGATALYYQSALSELLANKVADGLTSEKGKFVLVQMRSGTGMYGAGVVAAKTAYVAANPGKAVTITMPPYFNGDNLHLSAEGQIQMGYDCAREMFSFPDLQL